MTTNLAELDQQAEVAWTEYLGIAKDRDQDDAAVAAVRRWIHLEKEIMSTEFEGMGDLPVKLRSVLRLLSPTKPGTHEFLARSSVRLLAEQLEARDQRRRDMVSQFLAELPTNPYSLAALVRWLADPANDLRPMLVGEECQLIEHVAGQLEAMAGSAAER